MPAAALVYPRALANAVLPRTSTPVDPLVTTIPESVLWSAVLFEHVHGRAAVDVDARAGQAVDRLPGRETWLPSQRDVVRRRTT